ncbi:Guanine nucleotide exchange factor lte1 [Tilletia horrida]|nr:Guanine nucleotide exchange factor lte1 [Tilletia horrida]
MLKKQGKRVLRGPRSIPNLRLSSGGSKSGSSGGLNSDGKPSGTINRPAMPALAHAAFQGGGGAQGGAAGSAQEGGSSAVPFPAGSGLTSPPASTRTSFQQPPQIALTEYGDDFQMETSGFTRSPHNGHGIKPLPGTTSSPSSNPSGAGLSSSPNRRSNAGLTEGDVWGALLGTNIEGTPSGSSSTIVQRRREDEHGLGLTLHQHHLRSRGLDEEDEEQQRLGADSDKHDADVSEGEDSVTGDHHSNGGHSAGSASLHGSTGFGQARRRRRLQALKAGASEGGMGTASVSSHHTNSTLSPSVKFQTLSVADADELSGGQAGAHRSASTGGARSSWRSISPFGPAVLVKPAATPGSTTSHQSSQLRKVASSGLRHVRAAQSMGSTESISGPPTILTNRLGPNSSTSASTHSGTGPGSPDMSEGHTPNVPGSQTPRLQPSLREAPSFTSSTGSHRTARGNVLPGGTSDAHSLFTLGSDGASSDLQGLGEDAELVLQYPAEPLSRSMFPAVGAAGSSSSGPADEPSGSTASLESPLTALPAPEPPRYPKAFLPYLERSTSNDPCLIFDIFQTYSQVDPTDEADAKRLSLNTAGITGNTDAAASSHRRVESVDSPALAAVDANTAAGKDVPPSPATSYQSDNSASFQSPQSADRTARHLSASTTQSSIGGNAMPVDDPRFAIWTIRSAEQPPVVVAVGAVETPASQYTKEMPEFGASPKVPAPSSQMPASSRFSVRPPATPETPSRDRQRATFAQASPFAVTGDGSDVSTPVAPSNLNPGASGNSEARRKATQNRSTNIRDDVLLPLDKPTLLAATKSRLVAELTSEIDSRLLTDFFYTYRMYMTPCELFRLLSLRFQWALGEPCSPHDEARRRIVRVRTYTVLKYWLNNLFEYDFLSDGALRTELTGWLNTLAKDPSLANRPKDLTIIKSLKKTVRELKDRYSRSGVGGLLAGEPGVMVVSESAETPQLSSSIKSASPKVGEPEQKAPIASPRVQDDVDLVLAADDTSNRNSASGGGAPEVSPNPSTGEATFATANSSANPSRANSLLRSGNRVRSGSESLAPSWLEKRRTSSQQEERDSSERDGTEMKTSEAQPFLTAPYTLYDDVGDDAQGGSPHNGTDPFRSQGADFPGLLAEEPIPEAKIVMQPTTTVQNPLSKAISNTVTRLTKIGRALGSRGTLTVPFSSDTGASTNEQEAVELTDLLADPRQLQAFIDALRAASVAHTSPNSLVATKPLLEPTAEVSETSNTNSTRASWTGAKQTESESSQSDSTNLDTTPGLSDASESTPASSFRHRDSASGESGIDSSRSSLSQGALGLGLGLDPTASGAGGNGLKQKMMTASDTATTISIAPQQQQAPSEMLHRYTSNQTLRTIGSTEQQHSNSGLLAPAPALRRDFANYTAAIEAPSSANVVQLDDIDLSSDEDDGVVRRALRRLPGARDLRTTNHVKDLDPSGGAPPRRSGDGRHSYDSFSIASGHGPVQAAYSSIPASIVGSHHSGNIGDQFWGSGLPAKIGTVTTEMLDPDEALKGYELVPGFRLDAIESDEEEPGDVEAALRRLEGILDEEKQKEKARRVERLFQASMARNAARERASKRMTVAVLGETSGATSVSSDDWNRSSVVSKAPSSRKMESILDEERDAASVRDSIDDAQTDAGDGSLVAPAVGSDSPKKPKTYADQRSPFLRNRNPSASPKGGRPPLPAGIPARAARPLTFGAVPGVDLLRPAGRTTRQGRVLMNAGGSGSTVALSSSSGAGNLPNPSPRPPLHLPVMHYSFLLNSAPETIARQFTLIEAELFKAVTWDELVSGRWKERTLEALDWETFYQRTARRKADCIGSGKLYKERAVDAIIARFNLMCGWVASEVVLTQSIEMRAKLLAKLIRVAWKCYEQHNHATLTQILVGLQFPAVERLHKTWARLSAKHRRIFKDLKTFTSPKWNFAYLRGAIQSKLVDLKVVELMLTTGMSTSTTRNPYSLTPMQAPSGGGSDGTGTSKSRRLETTPDGFIPFFGLFNATLQSAEALPTYIDPSAPSAPVDLDPATGELRSLANPDAFEQLAPLPPSIKLEPLVNVYKLRSVALTVKTILAFQERAAAYGFEADRSLYVKCFKVRTLQGHQLAALSAFVEP